MQNRSGNFGSQNGAVFVTVALAIPLVVALILYVSHMYRVFQERARMQELADAAAVGAASMQARSLNAIALLNDGLLGIEGLAAGVFVAGNSAALVLDTLVITAPEGVSVHKEGFEITRRLGELARQVATLQDMAVPLFEFTPLFAAQFPLFVEDFEPLPFLLPYPLPGMSGLGLSLALPVEKRGFGFENLMAQANDFAVSGAKVAMGSVQESFPFDERMKDARDGCRMIVKAADTVSLFPIKKKVGKRQHAMVKGCKKIITQFADGNAGTGLRKALAKLLQGPSKPQSEFPPPLVLTPGYAEKYQIAVLAVRCKPWVDCDRKNLKFRDFNFSIAQARAHSNSQRVGGDLLIADFSARLVPVSVLDLAAAAGSEVEGASELKAFMEQGPWATQH